MDENSCAAERSARTTTTPRRRTVRGQSPTNFSWPEPGATNQEPRDPGRTRNRLDHPGPRYRRLFGLSRDGRPLFVFWSPAGGLGLRILTPRTGTEEPPRVGKGPP
jgi:hypothetical protein